MRKQDRGRLMRRGRGGGDMPIDAGIRTPAQVIALALEDGGIEPGRAATIAEDAGRRLSRAIRSVSKSGAEVVVRSTAEGVIEWGTVHT